MPDRTELVDPTTDKSATAITVVSVVTELFSGAGSGWVAETVAELLAIPARLGTIITVFVATAPTGRAPTVNVTCLPVTEWVPPGLLVALTNVAPAGKVSMIVTLLAAVGPRLVTVNV